MSGRASQNSAGPPVTVPTAYSDVAASPVSEGGGRCLGRHAYATRRTERGQRQSFALMAVDPGKSRERSARLSADFACLSVPDLGNRGDEYHTFRTKIPTKMIVRIG
jgi:hypothetical protein